MKTIYLKSLLVPALLCSQLASASVVLLSDDRSVTHYNSLSVAPYYSLVNTKPTTPFADFNTAGQTSQVSSTQIGGNGKSFIDSYHPTICSNYETGCDSDESRTSVFQIKFRVDEAQIMDFTATLGVTTSPTLYPPSDPTFSEFLLTGPDGFKRGWAVVARPDRYSALSYYVDPADIIAIAQYNTNASANIAGSIALLPGEYTLHVAGMLESGSTGDTASYSFQASFPAEVPVPAAGWLLLSALGSIGTAHRLGRRNRNA